MPISKEEFDRMEKLYTWGNKKGYAQGALLVILSMNSNKAFTTSEICDLAKDKILSCSSNAVSACLKRLFKQGRLDSKNGYWIYKTLKEERQAKDFPLVTFDEDNVCSVMSAKEFSETASKLKDSIMKLDERKVFKLGEVK